MTEVASPAAPPKSPAPATTERWFYAAGIALVAITVLGILAPASIIENTEPVRHSQPLTRLYRGFGGQTTVVFVIGALCAAFVAALATAAKAAGPGALRYAVRVSVLLTVLFVLAYPSGSRDIFKNISDTRTLWVYGESPLTVPPGAHPDDPLLRGITQQNLEMAPANYGPLFYVLSVPGSVIGGEDLLANMVTFKVTCAIAFLAIVALIHRAMAGAAPALRLQAVVLTGWNPLLLFEGVANAHNDVIMGAFMLAACLLAARRAMTGVGLLALSVAVKYATAFAAPVFAVWHYRRGEMRPVAALAVLGVIGIVSLAVLEDTLSYGIFVRELRHWTPYSWILHVTSPVLGKDASVFLARYLCLAAFAGIALLILSKVDTSHESLVRACFWMLAATSVLTVSYFWPWYFLWFVPLAALLAGKLEAEFAAVISCSGLLAYTYFPYHSITIGTNIFTSLLIYLPPVLYLLLFRKQQPEPLPEPAAT